MTTNLTAAAPAVPGRALRPLVPLAPLLGLAVVAGVTTVSLAYGRGAMAGTMGLGLPAFAGMWAVMMAGDGRAHGGGRGREARHRWAPVGRVAGFAALVLAVAVWWMPGLTAGLHPDPHHATM
jgi:hypothetical protein